MKKKTLSTLLATIITIAVNAQCENFEWAKRINAGRVSERVIADPMGNVYTLANNIDQNIFINTQSYITKHNAQGDSLWTAVISSVNISTQNNDYSTKAYDFVLDNAGNIYIGGWFQQHVDFNPGTATHQLSSDTWTSGFEEIYGRNAYLLKLDAQGNFVWAKKYGDISGATSEEFWSLSIDNSGNIYAAGQNNINGLLFKINSGNGNVIWQKNIAGSEPQITFDNNNHLYLTGYFVGTKDFDPSNTVYNLTSSGLRDTYVMKLDSAGNFVWANQLGGSGHDAGKSLAADGAGNVFVTGYYTGTATYQSGGTPVSLPAGNGNNRNGFIAKMNPLDGNFTWVSWFRDASPVTGSIHEEGSGIATDQSGNVYVTGYYTRPGITSDGQAIASNSTNDIILFKLDKTNGNYTWISRIGGGASDSGKDIAVDANDNVLVTGLYNDKLTAIGYSNVPSQDSIDFDPSAQSAHYLADNGGLTNRFLLKLSNKITSVVSHTVCEGIQFDFNGNILTEGGVYYDTLSSISGCDSIVTLTLNVFPVTTDSLFVTINQGDVYDFNGNPISTPGVYTDTLTSVNNCDSLLVLTLLVENTMGISSVAAGYHIKIYPNPTGGIVYFSETVNVRATNALGQVVADTKNVNALNLSNQPAGVYFLTLTDNKTQVLGYIKILKE